MFVHQWWCNNGLVIVSSFFTVLQKPHYNSIFLQPCLIWRTLVWENTISKFSLGTNGQFIKTRFYVLNSYVNTMDTTEYVCILLLQHFSISTGRHQSKIHLCLRHKKGSTKIAFQNWGLSFRCLSYYITSISWNKFIKWLNKWEFVDDGDEGNKIHIHLLSRLLCTIN